MNDNIDFVELPSSSDAFPMEDDFYEPVINNYPNRDQEEQKMEGVDEEVHTQPINEPVS